MRQRPEECPADSEPKVRCRCSRCIGDERTPATDGVCLWLGSKFLSPRWVFFNKSGLVQVSALPSRAFAPATEPHRKSSRRAPSCQPSRASPVLDPQLAQPPDMPRDISIEMPFAMGAAAFWALRMDRNFDVFCGACGQPRPTATPTPPLAHLQYCPSATSHPPPTSHIRLPPVPYSNQHTTTR